MKPVPITVRTSESRPWYVASPTTSPSTKAPDTFTTTVPYGNRAAVRDCTSSWTP